MAQIFMNNVCRQQVLKASQTSIGLHVVVRSIFSQYICPLNVRHDRHWPSRVCSDYLCAVYLSIKYFSSIRFVVQRIQQSDVHTMQIHALLRFEFGM